MVASGIIFSSAAFSQSGQKYATGGNNLNSNDKLGSKNNAPLRFVTDNTERARISETGFFGIGTTAPDATLTVNGTFKFTDGNQQNGYVLTSNGNGLATWQSLSSNNTSLWQQNGNDIFYNAGNVDIGNNLSIGSRLDVGSFFEAGNDTVRITSNYSAINSGMFCIGGLMGVGGAVPSVALDVNGDFKLTGNAEVQQNVKFTGLPMADSSSSINLLSIDNQNNIVVTPIPIDIPPPSLSCYPNILWGHTSQNTNTADVVLCAFNKKVGIGTSPQEKLHVAGNILSENEIYATNKIGIGTTTPFEAFNIVNDDPCIGLDINGNSTNKLVELRFKKDGNIKANVYWNKNDEKLYLNNNNINALFVNNTGKIGINTTSVPSNVQCQIESDEKVSLCVVSDYAQSFGYGVKSVVDKDDVKAFAVVNTALTSSSCPTGEDVFRVYGDGKVEAKEVDVFVEGWCDYVFADDYVLPNLNEVEAFIQQNKHLPDIPSEATVMEEGISLGEMDALLLKKVEELTLYVIELKKENEQQQKLIEELSRN